MERKTFGQLSYRICHTLPVFKPSEHDLVSVPLIVVALIVFYRVPALLSAGDTGAYPFVFQCISEPVIVIVVIHCTAVHCQAMLWQGPISWSIFGRVQSKTRAPI